MYDVDVLDGMDPANATARGLVLGGEGAAWGEEADGSTALQTMWPRAAAIAERLWSYNMEVTSGDPSVALRLAAFRCLLLARGVPAAPLRNLVARTAPSGPGSCADQ
jgi:hexosaminidase